MLWSGALQGAKKELVKFAINRFIYIYIDRLINSPII